MPRTKTPIRERIEKAKTEIRQGEHHINELLQKDILAERKQRTLRLIERGAIVESLIDGATEFTNEQIKQILQAVLRAESDSVHLMIMGFRSENNSVVCRQEHETSETLS